jgi:hypothetical protein
MKKDEEEGIIAGGYGILEPLLLQMRTLGLGKLSHGSRLFM